MFKILFGFKAKACGRLVSFYAALGYSYDGFIVVQVAIMAVLWGLLLWLKGLRGIDL